MMMNSNDNLYTAKYRNKVVLAWPHVGIHTVACSIHMHPNWKAKLCLYTACAT